MKTIKIWVDDIRLPPDDSWVHSKSVNLTKARIQTYEKKRNGNRNNFTGP